MVSRWCSGTAWTVTFTVPHTPLHNRSHLQIKHTFRPDIPYIRFLPHIPSYFVFFLSFISRSFWLKTVSHIQCPINGTQNPPEISGGWKTTYFSFLFLSVEYCICVHTNQSTPDKHRLSCDGRSLNTHGYQIPKSPSQSLLPQHWNSALRFFPDSSADH